MIDPEDKEYYTRLDTHRELEARVAALEQQLGTSKDNLDFSVMERLELLRKHVRI